MKGWGCSNGNCQSVAVLVFHPKLGVTINYGEVDNNKVRVKVGDNVTKGFLKNFIIGQAIGVASYWYF